MKRLVLVVFGLAVCVAASAQRWSLSTNTIDYLNFGTLNLEGSASVSQHISLYAGGRYNPWTLNEGKENQKQNRQRTMYLGFRYWPWHIYSGWWFAAKAQYEEYNHGGIIKQETEEGDAYGAGIGAGYTLMLSDHWNVEFGGYLWGGRKQPYTVYACPKCGRIIETGNRTFFAADDVLLSFVYVF